MRLIVQSDIQYRVFFFFFRMHFLTGEIYTPEWLIVQKIPEFQEVSKLRLFFKWMHALSVFYCWFFFFLPHIGHPHTAAQNQQDLQHEWENIAMKRRKWKWWVHKMSHSPFILTWNSPMWLSSSLSSEHMCCMQTNMTVNVKQIYFPKNWTQYTDFGFVTHLRAFPKAPAGLTQALPGLFAPGGRVKSCHHFTCSISEPPLYAVSIV